MKIFPQTTNNKVNGIELLKGHGKTKNKPPVYYV